MEHTATYSPEDDKIRIYPAHRLDADEYQQVKGAGFSWAPKQECFYAVWSPTRENTALQFAAEIEDEDKSLVERAEERAERFDGYSENRAKDGNRAHSAVKQIADGIPFGQPILIGHHSEKRARRDAQKIENGMRLAVKMWETSEYWSRRAAGALAAAKYKERPDVRARRIKGLEADRRKQERSRAEAEKGLAMWTQEGLTLETARRLSGMTMAGHLPCEKHPHYSHYRSAYDVLRPEEEQGRDCAPWSLEQVQEKARTHYPAVIAHCDTWIAHIDNRLLYERAMLQEAGGLITEQKEIEIGGRVLVRGEWCTVLKVNRKGGVITSLQTNRRYVSKVSAEEVKGYEPPTTEQAEATKKATAAAPICNYPAETVGLINRYHGTVDQYGVTQMSKAEWNAKHKDYKGTRDVPATEAHARHRVRIALVPGGNYKVVFITDEKRKDPPPPETETPARIQAPEPADRPAPRQPKPEPAHAAELQAMKQSLKTGVQTVTAPQLFPTPERIAAQMVEWCDIENGMTVLEPSAGTGRLIEAIGNAEIEAKIIAYEINHTLAGQLQAKHPMITVIKGDFLETGENPETFDRIIMNPPFENGADIKHIRHALGMLNPGGRLVSLCANGPRQREAFQELAEYWDDLPAGSFKEQGTGVNVALLVIAA